MGKQRPLFSDESQLFGKTEQDDILKQGASLQNEWAKQAMQPQFNPYEQYKAYNPQTGQKDRVVKFDPKSMITPKGVDYSKLPYDILKSRAAFDELQGKVAPGYSNRIKDEYDRLMNTHDRIGGKLGSMNAIQQLAPLAGQNDGLPSAYHQRYEWVMKKLKDMGVVDKASYDKAKQTLQKEGGADWYNLQQLIQGHLKDADRKPVSLKDEDLYSVLSQQNSINNYAKPYALQMLGMPEEAFQKKEQSPQKQESQTPTQSNFGRPEQNYEEQFKAWREKSKLKSDVSPQEMAKGGKHTMISKEAVKKEKDWWEGALVEAQLNRAIETGAISPYQAALRNKLQRYKDKIDGKHDPSREGLIGSVLDGIEHLSEGAWALGEFFASPIDAIFSGDAGKKEAAIEKQVKDREALLNAMNAKDKYLDWAKEKGIMPKIDNANSSFFRSPDDPDKYVFDKKKLTDHGHAETAKDSFVHLLDKAYNKKFTVLGGIAGAVGGPVGSAGGAVLGSAIDAAVSGRGDFSASHEYMGKVGGEHIDNVGIAEALHNIADNKEGLNVSLPTNDKWGVSDPMKTLLHSGIRTTGEILIDVAAANPVAGGIQTAAKGSYVAAKNTQHLSKAIDLVEKAGKVAGKPLEMLADTKMGANVIPFFGKMFQSGAEGALIFGTAELLKQNPHLTPEQLIDATLDGAVWSASGFAVESLIAKGAQRAGAALSKWQMDGAPSTISKTMIDRVKDVAKLQAIKDKGIGYLAEVSKEGAALRGVSQVIAGGVSEPVQTLAENTRKYGNPLEDFTGVGLVGDIVGGMIFGAFGVGKVKRPRINPMTGQPEVDSKGNPIMETVPFASARDVKRQIEAEITMLHQSEVSEQIQQSVKNKLGTQEAQEASAASPASNPLTDFERHTLDMAENNVEDGEFVPQSPLEAQSAETAQTAPQDAAESATIRETQTVAPKVANTLKETFKEESLIDPEADPLIEEAAEAVASFVDNMKKEGIEVNNDTIQQYSDRVAAQIAFLHSKGANVAVLQDIGQDGDTKYGYYASKKGDDETLQSVIALNIPKMLETGKVEQKSFHEFNHRLRDAIDRGAIQEDSAITLEELQEAKQQETDALKTLIEASPYAKKLYDAHIEMGLSEDQALEEMSSVMMEQIYLGGGNANNLLKHIYALDKKMGLEEVEPTISEPSNYRKLIGRAPKVIEGLIAPLQNYFKAAKASAHIEPAILQQAEKFQKYYDAALGAVTLPDAPLEVQESGQLSGQESGQKTQDSVQDRANSLNNNDLPSMQNGAILETTLETIPSPQDVDEHLRMFSSQSIDELTNDLDWALRLDNISDMRGIPSFLKDNFGLRNATEIYHAFTHPNGVFANPATFAEKIVELQQTVADKLGKEFTAKEVEEARRFGIKTWVKFQGYEKASDANLIIEESYTPNGEQLHSVTLETDPARKGGVNAMSKINQPARTFQMRNVNYENFIRHLDTLEDSLRANGLDSPLSTSPLIQTLRGARAFEIRTTTIFAKKYEALNKDNVDNLYEEAKFETDKIYDKVPQINELLLKQGYMLWNHAQQGETNVIDMQGYLNSPNLPKGVAGMNKMFINYYISNFGQPFTYDKVKLELGGKEYNALNYINYVGKPKSNDASVIVDAARLSKDFQPDSSEYQKALEAVSQLAPKVEQYVNDEVLKGYAHFLTPDPADYQSAMDDSGLYFREKAQSIVDALMHLYIDPSLSKIKLVDSYDTTTGKLKLSKANEKYMRGAISKNSVPLEREKFLQLPFIADHVKNGKLDLEGFEDDGTNIYGRGYVLNTKKAKEILAPFPILQKVLTAAVIDGGVINLNEESMDLITLLGGKEGYSNKTHGYTRLPNGGLNFKQAIHRNVWDSVNEQLLNEIAPEGQTEEVQSNFQQEWKAFTSLMKAANIQWIIPDSALKSNAQYTTTKEVPTVEMYGKRVVLGVKGNIIGEYDGETIKPMEEFSKTGGDLPIMLDKEPFSSPLHPTVIALKAGHGLVKIPITGAHGLQWMDSIAPSKRKPRSGGLPAQLLFREHPAVNANGFNGLNPNEGLQSKFQDLGVQSAFDLVVQRVARHGALERDRLWNGYLHIFDQLEGAHSPSTEADAVFMLEKLAETMNEDEFGLNNTAIAAETLLRNAVYKEGDKKKVNYSMLGPLLLMSETILENEQGKLSEVSMRRLYDIGSNTKLYSLMKRLHEAVFTMKSMDGYGAMPVLVPDLSMGKQGTVRAMQAIESGVYVAPNGDKVHIDVSNEFKDDKGNVDMIKLQSMMDAEVDAKTGQLKDLGQGVVLGYDYFKKTKAKIGDKVMLSIIPMTDISDMVPMRIIGISQHQGTITYNSKLALEIQGRDHDIDKVSFQLSDPSWMNSKGIDTFDVFWEALTHNQVHKAWGKQMLVEAKSMVDSYSGEQHELAMHTPYKTELDGSRAPVTGYAHPFANKESTKAAREYIAAALYDKFQGQIAKGLLPLPLERQSAIVEIREALAHNFKDAGVPVAGLLHHKYGSTARKFYGKSEIGKSVAEHNKYLRDRQLHPDAYYNNNNSLNDMLLRETFGLSYGKEGAVDIFSNFPFEVNSNEDAFDTLAPRYIREKMPPNEGIKYMRKGMEKGDFEQKEQVFGMIERAAVKGVSRPAPNSIMVKKILQKETANLMKDARQLQISEAESQPVQRDVEAIMDWGLKYFLAMDTANMEADYNHIKDFFAENTLGGDVAHKAVLNAFIANDSRQGSALGMINSQGQTHFTREAPFELTFSYGRRELKNLPFTAAVYSTLHPETGHPDRGYIALRFPVPASQVAPYYRQEVLEKRTQDYPSMGDVIIDGNEVHIPLDKLFDYKDGDKFVHTNPLLVNPQKNGWLQLFDEAAASMSNGNTYGKGTNMLIEALIANKYSAMGADGKPLYTKTLPTISMPEMSMSGKATMLANVLVNYIQATANPETTAGILMSQPLPEKNIVSYLIEKARRDQKAALHNEHKNTHPDTLSEEQILRYINQIQVGNNAIQKLADRINTGESIPFALTALGMEVYKILSQNSIIPKIGENRVMGAAMVASRKAAEKILADPASFIEPETLYKGTDGAGMLFSSEIIDELADPIFSFDGLLPTPYLTDVMTKDNFARDWSRLVNVSRLAADTYSGYKTGTGINMRSPEQHFNRALRNFATDNGIPESDLGSPQVLDRFLRSELKKQVGEKVYDEANFDTAKPNIIVATLIKERIKALSPQLVARNDFVTSAFVKDKMGKSAVQMETLKDIYTIWADIQGANAEQNKKDRVQNLVIQPDDSGWTKTKKSFMKTIRKINPGIRGTSRSIVDRYSTFYRGGNSTDIYYETFIYDEQGQPQSIQFANYLLDTTNLTPQELSARPMMVSVSSQFSDMADIERLKSFEHERKVDPYIKAFADVIPLNFNERIQSAKSFKTISKQFGNTFLPITSRMEGGIPIVEVAGMVLHGNNLLSKEKGVKGGSDIVTEHILEKLDEMVHSPNFTKDHKELAQSILDLPHVHSAIKMFLHKLLWQTQNQAVASTYVAQLTNLMGKLKEKGLEGAATVLQRRISYFDKIARLGNLNNPTAINEEGAETISEEHKWALGYFPQTYSSPAHFISALRKNLINFYSKSNAEQKPSVQQINDYINKAHADIIASAEEELSWYEQLKENNSQLLANPSIAKNALPRIIQELMEEDTDAINPVNGDVLADYSRNLSKSYLGATSFALEHLYQKELYDESNAMSQRAGERMEAENAFVKEEVLSSLAELRGDQYVWDKYYDSYSKDIEAGSPLQVSYHEGDTHKFISGYYLGEHGGNIAMFDNQTKIVQFVDRSRYLIDYIAVGRPISSPFGIRKTGDEKIQGAIKDVMNSSEVQGAVEMSLAALNAAKADPDNSPNSTMIIKTKGEMISEKMTDATRQSASRKVLGDLAVTGSVYMGYLGGSNLVKAGILGLGSLGAFVAGFPFGGIALGTMSLTRLFTFAGTMAQKTSNNIISSNREHLMLNGVVTTFQNMFGLFTKEQREEEAKRDLQQLPSFIEEELGLEKEYTSRKKALLHDRIQIMNGLNKFFFPKGGVTSQTARNFLKLKEQFMNGQVSYDAMKMAADAMLPEIEKSYNGKRDKLALALKNAAVKYGYEPFVQKFFDETGMTVDEMVEMKKHYAMEALKTVTKLIPWSETTSKRLADLASYNLLNDLGVASQMSDIGKQRGITRISQLSVGEYGGRNLLERTKLGRFLSLYSRFRRTANAYLVNDAVRNINMQSFVQDVAKHFPQLQYEYSDALRPMGGMQIGGLKLRNPKKGTHSTVTYHHDIANPADVDKVTMVKDYPYLEAYQRKLKYSTAMGIGSVMFKYSLPLLLAGILADDEDDDPNFFGYVADVFKGASREIEEYTSYTGLDNIASSTIAFATTAITELLSSLLYEDAVEQKIIDGSWTKTEAETWYKNTLMGADDMILTLGMGKGSGAFTSGFTGATYGNLMALGYKAGVFGDGYWDDPDQHEAFVNAADKRDAAITNQFLSTIPGLELVNTSVAAPFLEIGGAIQNDINETTKRKRRRQTPAPNVLAKNKPYSIIQKQELE